MYRMIRTNPDGTVRSWPTPVPNAKAKVVCGTCNNTWMSDLENRAIHSAMEAKNSRGRRLQAPFHASGLLEYRRNPVLAEQWNADFLARATSA